MDKIEQAKQITAGLTHYLRAKINIADFEIEELHKRRFAICMQCEFREPDFNTCGICGCILALKTRSIKSDCPNEYW